MRERYPGMLAVRVETLRSVLLPQLMVEEVEGLGPVLLLPAMAVRAVASVLKGRQPALLRHTVAVAVAVLLQQA